VANLSNCIGCKCLFKFGFELGFCELYWIVLGLKVVLIDLI